MNKKKLTVLIVCLLSILFSFTIFAAAEGSGKAPYLVDDADILSDSEEIELSQKLAEVSESCGMDVVIYTTNHRENANMQDFTDRYLEDNGFGQGRSRAAIAYALDMGDRSYATSTMGDAIPYFPEDKLTRLDDATLPYFSAGKYGEGFKQYIVFVEETVKNGGTTSFVIKNYAAKILFALVTGIIVAFLITYRMKRKMKTVLAKASASDYYRREELKVSEHQDIFLYRDISRVKRNNSSNGSRGGTHISSGGVRHGGHSGHF